MAEPLRLFDVNDPALGQNFPPVPGLARGARRYARNMGQQFDEEAVFAHVASPEAIQRGLTYGTAWMQGLSEPTPETMGSYRTFSEDTKRQFDFLTRPQSRGGLGIEVNALQDDPYDTVEQARADVVNNGRLNVLATSATGSHPVLTDDENDMFRATHDAFGHLAIGRNFTRHGEEAAFRAHRGMYLPSSHAALASETRGQNSRLVFARELGQPEGFGPNAPSNLPQWFTEPKGQPPARERKSGPDRQLRLPID